MSFISAKAGKFTESVIREMTRVCREHNGINLAQGFPDFPCPQEIKDAACAAIQNDVNQYAITWGAKRMREALAAKTKKTMGLALDPDKHFVITCGSTEAMISAVLATVNPGEEIVVFEPYYENYWPDAVLSDATPRFVKLRAPDWQFDETEMAAAFNNKTKAIIVNTPNNPTGKVFTRDELMFIAKLCQKWNALCITDEIYEHILYDGLQHVYMHTLPGMEDRTISIGGLSKTYSVTGWRLGYTIASAELTNAVKKVHDFLTVGAPAPLQEAGAVALSLPESYYEQLARDYARKRDILMSGLNAAGFKPNLPRGAYYIMCDISGFGYDNDVEFTMDMIKRGGVAAVPGSSFYIDPRDGRHIVRFCFCKKDETLQAAGERLKGWNKKYVR